MSLQGAKDSMPYFVSNRAGESLARRLKHSNYGYDISHLCRFAVPETVHSFVHLGMVGKSKVK